MLAEALALSTQAVSESEQTLEINPSYHPATHRLAESLHRRADLLWTLGDPDQEALTDLHRAEVLLEDLVARNPEMLEYRAELARLIQTRVRIDQELGQGDDPERRLSRAIELADQLARDDPNHISNLALCAALRADLAAFLDEQGRTNEAMPLFERGLELLNQARARGPDFTEPKRTQVEVLAARARALSRSGHIPESLADVEQAVALATDDEKTLLHIVRAATLARAGDHRAAHAEVVAAEDQIAAPSRQLLEVAAVHAALSEAIRCDQKLSPAERADAAAAEQNSALEQIRRAGGAPEFQNPRRLLHALASPRFDPLRNRPDFQLLIMDLSMPAQPLTK